MLPKIAECCNRAVLDTRSQRLMLMLLLLLLLMMMMMMLKMKTVGSMTSSVLASTCD